MNSVELTNESNRDLFGHDRAAIFVDGDGVLKIGDAPGFGLRQDGNTAEKQREDSGSNLVGNFQMTKFHPVLTAKVFQ